MGTSYSWRGQPIYDIHEWTRERGEQMIRYRQKIYWPNGQWFWEYGEMPEAFWGNLRFNDERIEVGRYNP